MLSRDSIFFKVRASLENFAEHKNENGHDSPCDSIDRINVFNVNECEHTATFNLKVATDPVEVRKRMKRMKRGVAAAATTADPHATTDPHATADPHADDHTDEHTDEHAEEHAEEHHETTLTFTADAEFIKNCIIIAVVVSVVFVTFFVVYYLCNRELINELTGKAKRTLTPKSRVRSEKLNEDEKRGLKN
jgi:hypothetical protein